MPQLQVSTANPGPEPPGSREGPDPDPPYPRLGLQRPQKVVGPCGGNPGLENHLGSALVDEALVFQGSDHDVTAVQFGDQRLQRWRRAVESQRDLPAQGR